MNLRSLNEPQQFITIKSPVVWDFPDIRKPGLNLPLAIGKLQIFLPDMTPRLYSFLH